MIDFHTHSLFSDGELVPSELVRRAIDTGYRAIAITDHGDGSNLQGIIPNIVRVCEEVSGEWDVTAIPGIELTHAPQGQIATLANKARELGAKVVIVHGETIVEPVCKGTNRAALEADVDILAHPGFISEEEVALAKEKEIYLEISGRKGHSFTNGYVAGLARKVGAKLVINSDAHAPGDLMTLAFAKNIGLGAGMAEAEVETALKNAEELLEKIT